MQRLRAAGLRPTAARIAVLRLIEAAKDRISAEDVFRQLPARGARASIRTVYRVIHGLEQTNTVLREWDDKGTALYSLRPTRKPARLRLVCGDCHHALDLLDADLHARLLAALQVAGMEPTGPFLTLRVEQGGCHHHRGQLSFHNSSSVVDNHTHLH